MEAPQKIKVKIVKETRSRITIFLPTVNRKMHVLKNDFHERVEDGLYEVMNEEMLEEDKD